MPSRSGPAGRKSATVAVGNQALGRWPLQDAKARLSELVRKAQQDGPQRVTVHGRDSVVVLSEDDYARLTGARSGQLLVNLLASAPLAAPGADVEFEHSPVNGPVRDVKL
jgi:prevent-host-death family protein